MRRCRTKGEELASWVSAARAKEVLAGLQRVLQTSGPVVVCPASGTGAWEAALMNTCSPGDGVLMVETGHFATLWRQMAERLGLRVTFLPTDWRHPVDPAAVEEALAAGDKTAAAEAFKVAQPELMRAAGKGVLLSLIHISEPPRPY